MEVQLGSIEENSETDETVSSLPDFAQIFVFLQLFGEALHLSPVTLKDLENFFAYGYKDESAENNMIHIHWRLVRNVSRSEGIKEWQRMAVKFARKNGLVAENMPYSELDVRTRVKVLRLACEDQFELNVSFRKELKDLEMMEFPRVGEDSDGQRHWLLQDSNFDIRLYGESNYNEEPPIEAQWTELARTLSGLGRYVSTLEARRRRRANEEERGDDPMEIENGRSLEAEPKLNGVLEGNDKDSDSDLTHHQTMARSKDSIGREQEEIDNSSTRDFSASEDKDNSTCLSVEGMAPPTNMEMDAGENGEKNSSAGQTTGLGKERECNGAEGSSRRPKRRTSRTAKPKTSRQLQSKEKSSGRGKRRKSPQPQLASPPQDEGGCLKCHKDVDYEQMLLCDECDKECHTYCQYPRLWSIPKGKWICPLCSEGHLIEALKAVYLRLSGAREQFEKQLERKQKSVARLQKSGLLVQNIIEDADDGRRSRRSRKDVNYAELNDVYLPPLGPQDIVGNQIIPAVPSTRSRARRNDMYIQEDYLAPRVRSTSSRRRWRDLEEEGETSQEENVQEENRTISHSPPVSLRGGSLEVIAEEDENEIRSTTPDSAQNEPPSGHPIEVVMKKPQFTCLENNDDNDLFPVSTLVHQSATPPLPFRHPNVPSSFRAPPSAPPNHNHHIPVPQAPPLHVPPFQAPPTHHTPFLQAPPLQAPPLPLFGSVPFGGAVVTSKPYNMSSTESGNHYMKLPTNHNLPETLLCDDIDESVSEERKTLATTVTAPSLLTINRSTENKNLLSDQQQ